MELTSFWNQYLRCYDQLNSVNDYQNYFKDLAVRSGAESGRKVLDAGSGTGNLSIQLTARGADVTSLDFSHEGLSIHKEKDPDAKQMQASLEDALPFESDSFDIITCASVLFTLTSNGIHNALSEFSRILKPGGTLLVTAGRPELNKMAYTLQYYRKRFREQSFSAFVGEIARSILPVSKILYYNYRMYGFKRIGAYHRFEKNELIDLVKGNGFDNIIYDTVLSDKFHLILARNEKSPETK